ncbi:hypothetical protein GCM10017779_57360 [Streptomyces capillispiralis]|uniref:Uncharacterized protein n=2 Tax=Streptomyces capillispiralis TaxID=68182 RepID=A0A561THG1_9ACTN|nr:hypothetical protein FHX78_113524 [Streptomyces capillispiralis]GHH95279.1 hypothetical protein GCM10017779_57360 [Streptomyces capillispiralis]
MPVPSLPRVEAPTDITGGPAVHGTPTPPHDRGSGHGNPPPPARTRDTYEPYYTRITTLSADCTGMIGRMTTKVGPRPDGDWTERLGWAHGLIAPDPVDRAAALAHLADARAEVRAARARYHEAWRRTAGPGHGPRHRDPALAAAQRAYDDAASRCLPEALWNTPVTGGIATWPGLPFALLFLEWEARCPQDWTEHAKAWGTKQKLIRELSAGGHDAAVTAVLVGLVDLVVRRAYRWKDREYVRLARAVDGADLRGRLDRARQSDDPWAQLHARYVLWLLDRPATPNTRHVWHTWLTATDTQAPSSTRPA